MRWSSKKLARKYRRSAPFILGHIDIDDAEPGGIIQEVEESRRYSPNEARAEEDSVQKERQCEHTKSA